MRRRAPDWCDNDNMSLTHIQRPPQEFCKDFNAKTAQFKASALMRVKLTAFDDRWARPPRLARARAHDGACTANAGAIADPYANIQAAQCCFRATAPSTTRSVSMFHVDHVVLPSNSPLLHRRTFKYQVLAPPTSWYLKRVTGLTKGASQPGKETIGTVNVKAIYEIALSKQQFDEKLALYDVEAVAK